MPKGSLHNKFNDFGATPTENVWAGIEKSLDNKKKKRVLVIWWSTGLAAAVLVLFGLKSFYNTTTNSKINQHNNNNNISEIDSSTKINNEVKIEKIGTNSNIQIVENDQSIVNDTLEEVIKSVGSNIKFSQNSLSKSSPSKSLISKNNSELNIVEENKNLSNYNPILNLKEDKNTLDGTRRTENEIMAIDVPYKLINVIELNKNLNSELVEFVPPKDYKRKWSYSLVAQSNIGFISSEAESDGLANFSLNDPGGNNPPVFNDPYVLKETRPLSLRLGVARELTKRLKIKSGLDLSYVRRHSTKLYSEDFIMNNIYSFGIPIGLNYNYLNNKRWNFNVEANFLNDFAFITRSKSNELPANYSGVATSSLESSQISSSISYNYLRGLELINEFDYSLNENIRLTFSPGIKRYFNTAYLFNRKTFVSFNAGLKWRF